eukprot:3135962-Rhodomonas_salina.1
MDQSGRGELGHGAWDGAGPTEHDAQHARRSPASKLRQARPRGGEASHPTPRPRRGLRSCRLFTWVFFLFPRHKKTLPRCSLCILGAVICARSPTESSAAGQYSRMGSPTLTILGMLHL